MGWYSEYLQDLKDIQAAEDRKNAFNTGGTICGAIGLVSLCCVVYFWANSNYLYSIGCAILFLLMLPPTFICFAKGGGGGCGSLIFCLIIVSCDIYSVNWLYDNSSMAPTPQMQVSITPNNFTAFASKGDIGNMRNFLEGGFNVNTVDDNGNTAVAEAAHKGQLIALNFLFERGAKANAKNGNGESILDDAVKQGNVKIVKAVLTQLQKEGVDLKSLNSTGEIAVKAKNPDVLKALADAGVPIPKKVKKKK